MSGHPRRIIPSEELTEFQRWQFNSLLDKPLAPQPEAEPELAQTQPLEISEPEPIVEAIPEPVEALQSEAIANAMPYPTAEEIEAIQHQAHEEGYQAGLAEGRAQAQLELQQLGPLLQNIAQACQQSEQVLADSVLELALLVAKQMIGDELRQHPKQLLVPIREALAAIPTATNPAKLYLAPDDLQLLQHDLRYELPEDVWRFVADEQLSTGSCRIETPNTQLEFSLASRWKKIIGVLGSKQDLDFSLEQYGSRVPLATEPNDLQAATEAIAPIPPITPADEDEPDA
ncbi:FliH/SctL family protein [Chitinibacter sp. SCUT-21]|uniref:FliH/SctL family protein n=1 Tax=Chitinibacter sp. SCUT-21 TaxID=2970891 RepID=UPI0035A57EF4